MVYQIFKTVTGFRGHSTRILKCISKK